MTGPALRAPASKQGPCDPADGPGPDDRSEPRRKAARQPDRARKQPGASHHAGTRRYSASCSASFSAGSASSLPLGCCWVMQWMPPPPRTMSLAGTWRTPRCGKHLPTIS